MSEATVTEVTTAVAGVGADIATIGASVIIGIGLAMLAYRAFRRVVG